jgi:hypothetical protein
LKGQLDLEQHGGHTPQGVLVRVLQRLLAMTTAIWHNDHTGQPGHRDWAPMRPVIVARKKLASCICRLYLPGRPVVRGGVIHSTVRTCAACARSTSAGAIDRWARRGRLPRQPGRLSNTAGSSPGVLVRLPAAMHAGWPTAQPWPVDDSRSTTYTTRSKRRRRRAEVALRRTH